jgi:hypothetical protein
LTRLNPSGTDADYSTYLGSAPSVEARGVAVDSAGRAYVVGRIESPLLETTPNAFQKVYGGTGDGFLLRIDPDIAVSINGAPPFGRSGAR